MSQAQPSPRSPETVATLIRRVMGELSTSERKVARALLADYPVAGLETMAQLAARAGVSGPTVLRFASRLGFAGYPALQAQLHREVQQHMGSPVVQYAEEGEVPAGEQVLPETSEAATAALEQSFAELPASEFARTVQILGDSRLRIHTVGGRFSHVLATYLAAHLKLLRPDVWDLAYDEFSRMSFLGGASKDDVLVVFDYRRYDEATVRLASAAAASGTRVLLFTDPWLSPIAEVACTVLPSRVDSPSPFDSLIPAFALVEGVVTAVTAELGDEGRARVEQLEALRSDLGRAPAAHDPFL